jgi:hypothetical protein
MNARDMQTIRGYVQALPTAPGRDDPVRVVVVSDDGMDYHILHKGAGTGLLANINANVEVTGHVTPLASPGSAAEARDDAENGGSGYLLTVKQFRLTDGFDHPWYDDTVR